MPSIIRDIADILGITEAANPTKAVLTSTADGSGLVVYATPNLLPTSGFTAGDQAFVTSNKKLYISTASGWYAVATANLAPVITDNGLDTELVTGGSNVDVVLSATDPEGLPLTWTYEVTSGSIGGTTVSQVDNVFTFTPSSNVADEGTFNITFTADDGINTSNVVKTFNLSNDPPVIGSYTSSYDFATDGTPIILTLTATDPEGQDITWSYNVTSGSLGSTATVSQADNVFTITPSTNSSNGGEFTLTFIASDGTNSDTAAIAFSLSFGPTETKIQSSDIQIDDKFGSAVSINQDGTYAIIGTGEEDGGAGDPISNAGAAYVFTRSGSTWTQQQKLVASDAQAADKFGQSVSISSTASHVIIGAQYEDTGGSNAGAAYIFTRSGSTWTQQQKIQSSDIQAGDYFGWSASINSNGTYYIIGGPREDTGGTSAGAAYIYEAV